MSDRCQIECQLAGITRRQVIFIYQTNEQHINIQFDTVLLRHFYAVTNIIQNMLKPFINGTWEDLAIFYYFDTMLRPETPYAVGGSARCAPFPCRLAICGSPDSIAQIQYVRQQTENTRQKRHNVSQNASWYQLVGITRGKAILFILVICWVNNNDFCSQPRYFHKHGPQLDTLPSSHRLQYPWAVKVWCLM